MSKSRKVITDRNFHELWKIASESGTFEEMRNQCEESKRVNREKLREKYKIEIDEVLTIYKAIYEAYNTGYKEILEKANVSNSEISHRFCIPIRTVEAWKYGKNNCPDYVRLMLLRHFHLIDLGKYIYTQEYVEYIESIPRVYAGGITRERRKEDDITEIKQESPGIEDELDEFDRRMKALEEARKAREEIYRVSQQLKSHERPDILGTTDYMDEIISRRKKS
jgi:DNA-binding transcriptional regulator YiaG